MKESQLEPRIPTLGLSPEGLSAGVPAGTLQMERITMMPIEIYSHKVGYLFIQNVWVVIIVGPYEFKS